MTTDRDHVPNAEYVLLRDITAADLAMDSIEPGEGYPPEHVIGPKGSKVQQTADSVRRGDLPDDEWIEVENFANDPFAVGYVHRSQVAQIDSSGAT